MPVQVGTRARSAVPGDAEPAGRGTGVRELRGGSRLAYAPALDGLRAAAVALVIASHTTLPVPGGHVGVDVFFVLSGFLITRLLLEEHRQTGRLSLRTFFLHRVTRLAPALLALVAGVTAYAVLAPSAVRGAESLAGTLPALLYYANWVRALEGLGHLGLYEHTWSLSVEEQFYLLWPLVVLLLLRTRASVRWVALVGLAGAGASLVVRLLMNSGDGAYERISNGLDTRADQLLIGCVLAAGITALNQDGRSARMLVTALRLLVWPSAALLAVAALTWPRHGVGVGVSLAMTGSGLAAAVLVATATLCPTAAFSRLLAGPVAVYVGRRSYGLYLWHYPIFVIVYNTGVTASGLQALALGLAASFLMAELSARFVELPVLRWRRRLQPAGDCHGEPCWTSLRPRQRSGARVR